MRVAIYAEGRSDLAVIRNILKGSLDIDSADVLLDLPEYSLDETDLHSQNPAKFSNWTLVKNECQTRDRITTFFDTSEEGSFAVIQIDTAERFEKGYEVIWPTKSKPLNETYSVELRTNVITRIEEWLLGEFSGKLEFAICIEEIEAWVLTLHESKDSCKHNDPKAVLKLLINKKLSDKAKKQLYNKLVFHQFDELSKDFRKPNTLNKVKIYNQSLFEFCNSLDKRKEIKII